VKVVDGFIGGIGCVLSRRRRSTCDDDVVTQLR
jgi:hypothetical protein